MEVYMWNYVSLENLEHTNKKEGNKSREPHMDQRLIVSVIGSGKSKYFGDKTHCNYNKKTPFKSKFSSKT